LIVSVRKFASDAVMDAVMQFMIRRASARQS
jgi:hypothetical protein